MILHNKKVAVIGAGPGGLTLARLLQLKNIAVTVYERDANKNARVQGSPLDMHEGSGRDALGAAGLTEVFTQNVRHGADKKVIVDEQANIVFSDHNIEANNTEPQRPEIDRGTLRKIFLDALQEGTVIWDSHFISMERQGDGWMLHFKNGQTAYADLLVAADGANSKIRPYVTDIKAFYSDITMVEMNIENAAQITPNIYNLLNGGKVMAFGNGKCILGGQKGEGGLGFYASFKPSEHWATESGFDLSDRAQILNWFKQEYTGWSSVWDEIVKHTTLPIIPRPIYCMPLDQTWQAQPNLTLLGDAAHVMPPFAGEGANTSMFDALELSECLTSGQYHTLHDAIAAYETLMRKRASAAAKRSLENGERMHSQGALNKMMKAFGLS